MAHAHSFHNMNPAASLMQAHFGRQPQEQQFILDQLQEGTMQQPPSPTHGPTSPPFGGRAGPSSPGGGGVAESDGFAETASRRMRRMSITGTHGYRAPEVFNREYGTAADWWNVGILIVEMLLGDNPLRGENRLESEAYAKTREVLLPSDLTPATSDIIHRFLQKDPKFRLCNLRGARVENFRDVTSHPFFEQPVIEWPKLLERRHRVPFDMRETNVRPTPRELNRLLTPQTNQIDYFSQSVDYMAMSIKLRQSWQLTPDEQRQFEGFDFTSAALIEEELTKINREFYPRGGGGGGGGGDRCSPPPGHRLAPLENRPSHSGAEGSFRAEPQPSFRRGSTNRLEQNPEGMNSPSGFRNESQGDSNSGSFRKRREQ